MKKVLVTGGSGLIGLELCKQLIENKFKVICMDLPEQLEKNKILFKKVKKNKNLKILHGSIFEKSLLNKVISDVDAVFHLAAMLGVKRTEDNKLKCLEVNVKGTENILEACVSGNIKHLIFASSSEVYGEPSHNPINEKTDTQGKTVYGISKLAGEEYVKAYCQIYKKLNYTIVRFFNTYGENQVSQFFLAKIVRNIMSDSNPVIYGDGQQVRSFCHVEDSCEALIEIIKNKKSYNKIFNIGNSNEKYTLNEVAKIAIKTLKKNNLKIKNLPFTKSDRTVNREIFKRFCDISLAKKTLDFEPKISIEEGIKRISKNLNFHNDW